jgi:transcriptional regulator with XRE-family HTH domain
MPFHPVDVHVGTRMRQRRALLGMSQTSLGNAVGLTFQQVQKYERGSNRISASRLVEFAKVLDVPVSFFFDELPAKAVAAGLQNRGKGARDEHERDPLIKRETLELVRAYYKIRDPKVRKGLFEMIKALGAANAVAATATSIVKRKAGSDRPTST